MVVDQIYTRTYFLKYNGVNLGKSIQVNVLYAANCDQNPYTVDSSYIDEFYLTNTEEAQVVTSFSIGVDPWTEAYRVSSGDSTFNLLCGTYNYNIVSKGFGREDNGVY